MRNGGGTTIRPHHHILSTTSVDHTSLLKIRVIKKNHSKKMNRRQLLMFASILFQCTMKLVVAMASHHQHVDIATASLAVITSIVAL